MSSNSLIIEKLVSSDNADFGFRCDMVFVFFVYGLSFFILGLSILIYPKKDSMFKLARHLNLVAGFGLVHGMNEWLDMFLEIGKSDPAFFGTPESIYLLTSSQWVFLIKTMRMVALPVSFLFLVMFGSRVVCEMKKKCFLLKALPVILAGLWLLIFVASEDHFRMGDICARYLLCIPGAILTAWGLLMYLPQLEKAQLPVVIRHLKLAGIAFFGYSILAGLIVKKASFFPASHLNYEAIELTFGVPVQIVRAFCAVIMAYATFRILRIFRWETQNTIRQSELRFRTIATSVPVILFMEDCEGKITFLEGEGLDSLGADSIDLIGKPINTLFPGIDAIRQKEGVLKGGRTYSTPVTVDDITYEFCSSPVEDSAGETTGFIGVALDITERMRARAELERNRQEMTRTKHLTELGTISTAMTRQVERPLKITQLLLERLVKEIGSEADPESIAKALNKSLSEVNEAVSVVTRFSDFANLSAATQGRPIDLQRFVRRVIAVCAESAKRVDLELVTEDLDVVPSVSIAETELEYVFLVLIQTAIEASDPCKPERLTISCEMSDKHLRLAFWDTCRAIPADKLKNVFQPFFDARPNGKSSEFSLAVVSHIVNSAGGAITVESAAGKGTTFHLTLPVEQGY